MLGLKWKNWKTESSLQQLKTFRPDSCQRGGKQMSSILSIVTIEFWNFILKYRNYSHWSFIRGTLMASVDKSVLVHHPFSFCAFRGATFIKHESFLHTNTLRRTGRKDWLVLSCSFPIARRSCSVGTHAIWILPITGTEEKPFTFAEVSLVYRNVYIIYYNALLTKKMKMKFVHSYVILRTKHTLISIITNETFFAYQHIIKLLDEIVVGPVLNPKSKFKVLEG